MVYDCQGKSNYCACDQTWVKNKRKATVIVECKTSQSWGWYLPSDYGVLYELMVQADLTLIHAGSLFRDKVVVIAIINLDSLDCWCPCCGADDVRISAECDCCWWDWEFGMIDYTYSVPICPPGRKTPPTSLKGRRREDVWGTTGYEGEELREGGSSTGRGLAGGTDLSFVVACKVCKARNVLLEWF